jgi:hypothetical protein
VTYIATGEGPSLGIPDLGVAALQGLELLRDGLLRYAAGYDDFQPLRAAGFQERLQRWNQGRPTDRRHNNRKRCRLHTQSGSPEARFQPRKMAKIAEKARPFLFSRAEREDREGEQGPHL